MPPALKPSIFPLYFFTKFADPSHRTRCLNLNVQLSPHISGNGFQGLPQIPESTGIPYRKEQSICKQITHIFLDTSNHFYITYNT
jgi:hypothetical protein